MEPGSESATYRKLVCFESAFGECQIFKDYLKVIFILQIISIVNILSVQVSKTIYKLSALKSVHYQIYSSCTGYSDTFPQPLFPLILKVRPHCSTLKENILKVSFCLCSLQIIFYALCFCFNVGHFVSYTCKHAKQHFF